MADNRNIETGIQIDVNSNLDGLEEATEGLEQLNETSQESQENLENLGESAESTDAQFSATEEQIRQLLAELVRMANEAGGAGQGLRETGNEAKKSNETFEALKKKVLELGAAFASLFAAKQIGGFFSSATSQAADFEEQMRRVQAVMGLTDAEAVKTMGAIEAKAKELGASTRYTASEVAAAFEALARAGLSTSEQLASMNTILATAQGNSIDIARAADILISATSGMRLGTDEMSNAADILSKTAQSANLSIEGLNEGLSYVAPTASAMGMSLKEVSSWLAVLNQNGLQGSRAGTALNNALAQFSSSSSNFKQELIALGITTNNFGEAMNQLALKGAKAGKAIEAAGIDAGAGLKILANESGLGTFSKVSQSLENAVGSAQAAAQTMDKSLKGAVAGLGSAWEGLKLQLGKPLLEPIREQVNKLSQSVRDATGSKGLKTFTETLKGSFQVMATAIATIGKFSAQIVAVGTAYAAVKISILAYNAIIGTATALTNAFTAASMRSAAVIKTGIIGVLSAAVMVYQAFKSEVKDVIEVQNESNQAFEKTKKDLAELGELTNKLTNSTKEFSEADAQRAEEIKLNLQTELEAHKQRLDSYEKAKKSAEERVIFDEEAWRVALQNISVEKQRISQIEEKIKKHKEQEAAVKKVAEAEKLQAESIDKAKKGWDILLERVDDSRRALLELPERSRIVLKSLDDIGQSAEENGEKLAMAFRVGGEQLETKEAVGRAKTQLQSLATQGKITEDQLKETMAALNTRASELPDYVNNATVALNELGLTAIQVQTGISDTATRTIELFGTATKTYKDNIEQNLEQIGRITSAVLPKLTNPLEMEALNQKILELCQGNKELAQSIIQTAEAQRNAKTTADEQTEALNALGLSIDAVNQRMSKSGLEMAKNLQVGLSALREAGVSAKNFEEATQSAFETAISSAKTAEDFSAIKQALAESGASSKITAEQLQVLNAGMKGGKQAVDEFKQSLIALSKANKQLAQESEKLGVGSEELGDNLENLGNKAEKTAEAEKKISKESKNAKRSLDNLNSVKLGDIGANDLANDMNNAKNAIEEGADSVKRMDENFKSLTASARDSADSIAQQLASLRGQEESVLEMQNSQKLRQLQEKLNEAKARGNQEEVKQYQRAISLQRELYEEQQKQLEKKKTEEAQKMSNEPLSISNQAKTTNPSLLTSHSSLSAEDVANAFSAQIKEAEERAKQEGARLGKEQLAKELIAAAKRRNR